MANIWFTPVCDNILKRVAIWDKVYDTGIVYATRSFMSRDEVPKPINKPTIYLHKIRFTLNEMEHLVRILRTVIPDSVVTENFIKVAQGMKKGILIPPNYYEVQLAFYPNEVKEVLNALLAAKDGTWKKMDDLIIDQKEKAPFEI